MFLKTVLFLLMCSATLWSQSCPTGYIQTGTGALTTPTCTSVATNFDLVNRLVSAGTTVNGTLVSTTVAGMYGLRIYASPTTSNAIATVAVTITWTTDGISHSNTTAVLSLLSLGNSLSQAMPIYVDAGTSITYSVVVVGTAGAFSLHIDGRPPQV